MQIQLNHIAGREGVLREVGEEEFVDDPCACHPNRTLLVPGGMCGHDHAAGYSLRSHWKLWTIVEAARCLALLSAAGSDRGAGAAAPGSADDRAGGSLCHGSQTQTLPHRRSRPHCHIAHPTAAACAKLRVDTPSDTGQWR